MGADVDLCEAAQETQAKLASALQSGADGRIRSLVGTMQPTLQSINLGGGKVEFAESTVIGDVRRREDHGGDGTVFRYAAQLAGTQPSFLPQSHGAIAKTPEGIGYAAAVATDRIQGPYQGGSPIGVRVPDLAVAGEPFRVEITNADHDALCEVWDAESEELVSMPDVAGEGEDDRLIVEVLPPGPGTYRISVSGGGLSPIEHLVLVADPA